MTQIKLRRDTAANFTSKNPVLGVGEPAYETDTKKLKIGDGTTAYTQLEYFSAGGGSVDSYTKSETNALLSKKNDNIFDISKFTVVGSPTITDDGVASGFSMSNYLKTPIINFANSSQWEMRFRIPLGSKPPSGINYGFCGNSNTGFNLIYNAASYVVFNMLSAISGASATADMRFLAEENTVYDIIIGQNSDFSNYIEYKKATETTYSMGFSAGGHAPTKIMEYNGSLYLGAISSSGGQPAVSGSIDLKQLSITVDGEEVFNGLMSSTKPIYDAIKANKTELSEFKTETSNDFSAVNSALNEKANLSDLSLKQNRLVEGNNVTLTSLTDGTVRIDAAGGGGSANISATLPLKIVDGVISLEVDGQTIQIVDGKLHANLDELNNPFSLFDSKYSDHELNNLSWLKSEGQWNAKAVYTDAYDKLLKVHNGTETVGGLSVKLSTETYTDYDFVLNTADETFRLPLLNGSEDLPSNTVVSRADNTVINAGEVKTLFTASYNGFVSIKAFGAGITGACTFFASKNGVLMGCVGVAPNIYNQGTISFDVKRGDIVTINLDYQSMTYNYLYSKAVGNGSLYYYVGETVQNANLIDAGRIGEELVSIKASIDGDWTYKSLTFADSFSLPINTEGAGGVFTYDLSNYLPNDGYKYEVTISAEVNNSNFCTLGYYLPDNSWYCFAKGGNPIGGCFTAIVDSSRQVKISVVNTQEALMWAHAAAYRRLGKKV